jgi:hypothetical protein
MFLNVVNILMYSKLAIVDSMGNILKEVFIVSDGKIVEGGGKQLAQSLLLKLVEAMIMEKSLIVQHEIIPNCVIDLMGNGMFYFSILFCLQTYVS